MMIVGLSVLRHKYVGLGIPHRAGRYRPGGSPYSSPGRRSCRRMEGFLIRGWDPMTLSSPDAAGPRRCPEGQLSPRVGYMSPSQSANGRWGWGFHTVRVGIDLGNHRFRPRVVRVVGIWKGFWSGDRTLSSPGAARPRHWPEGATLAARWLHDSMSPSQLVISQWG